LKEWIRRINFNLKSDIIKADPIIYAENQHHANEDLNSIT
jgi:hypothetical protein